MTWPYPVPAASGGGASTLADLTDVDDALAPSNGDFLTYTGAGGGMWVNGTLQAVVDNLPLGLYPTLTLEGGASFTLGADHVGRTVMVNNVLGVVVTIATNATFPIPTGAVIELMSTDEATPWTIETAPGVLLNGVLFDTAAMAGGSSIRLVKIDTDQWTSLGVGIWGLSQGLNSTIGDTDQSIGADLGGGATLSDVITRVNKMQDNLRQIAAVLGDARIANVALG